jgi:hypothetical protein
LIQPDSERVFTLIGPDREYFAGIFEKPKGNREKNAEVTSVSTVGMQGLYTTVSDADIRGHSLVSPAAQHGTGTCKLRVLLAQSVLQTCTAAQLVLGHEFNT